MHKNLEIPPMLTEAKGTEHWDGPHSATKTLWTLIQFDYDFFCFFSVHGNPEVPEIEILEWFKQLNIGVDPRMTITLVEDCKYN